MTTNNVVTSKRKREDSEQDEAKKETHTISPPIPMQCEMIKPQKYEQRLVDGPTLGGLDQFTILEVVYDILSQKDCNDYIRESLAHESRKQDGFGLRMLPHYDIFFGESRFKIFGDHKDTKPFPPYFAELETKFKEKSQKLKLLRCVHAIDSVYDASLERGGKFCASAKEHFPDLMAIAIFSVGQTRILRIRRRSDKTHWVNVVMPHNSLVVMHGARFHDNYSFQMDTLSKYEPIGTHLSLKMRFVN